MVFKDPAGSKQAQIQLAAQEKQVLQSLSLLKNKDYKAPPMPAVPAYQTDMSTYTTPLHKMHCLKKLLEMEYDHYVCVGNPSCAVYCECKEKTKAFEDALVKYISQYHDKSCKDKPQFLVKPDGQVLTGATEKTPASLTDDDCPTSSDDEEENTFPQVNINIV